MSSTALKFLAMFLMLLDHIHQFIPDTPLMLTWLGRASAPLFFFCSAWGFYYTRNRVRYLCNLYLWNIGMALGTCIVTRLVSFQMDAMRGRSMTVNNIFQTLLLSFIVVQIVEDFQKKNHNRAAKLLLMLFMSQLVSLFTYSIVMQLTNNYFWAAAACAFFPCMFLCEGGVIFVGLGVGLYFARKTHLTLCVMYGALSMSYLLGALRAPLYENLFLVNYQWMMIAALPLMLCYNGQKGRGLKWVFYLFYPAHIYILYFVAFLMQTV